MGDAEMIPIHVTQPPLANLDHAISKLNPLVARRRHWLTAPHASHHERVIGLKQARRRTRSGFRKRLVGLKQGSRRKRFGLSIDVRHRKRGSICSQPPLPDLHKIVTCDDARAGAHVSLQAAAVPVRMARVDCRSVHVLVDGATPAPMCVQEERGSTRDAGEVGSGEMESISVTDSEFADLYESIAKGDA